MNTVQAVSYSGMRQTVHVLITTYTEPAVTVRECVLRLLVAPEPIYMEKMIYVCDDGHLKSEGPKKRAMVEELRILGKPIFSRKRYLCVFWIEHRTVTIGACFFCVHVGTAGRQNNAKSLD